MEGKEPKMPKKTVKIGGKQNSKPGQTTPTSPTSMEASLSARGRPLEERFGHKQIGDEMAAVPAVQGGWRYSTKPKYHLATPKRVVTSSPKSDNTSPSVLEPEAKTAIEFLEDAESDDDTDIEFKPNRFQRCILKVQGAIAGFVESKKKIIKLVFYIFLLVAWHAFVIAACVVDFDRALPVFILTILGWIAAFYELLYKPRWKDAVVREVCDPIYAFLGRCFRHKVVKLIVYAAVVVAIAIFIIVDAREQPIRLLALAGLFSYLLLGFLLSKHSARINWRPVLSGLLVQFCLSLVIFRWKEGLKAFGWASNIIVRFLQNTHYGTSFVYGFIATPPKICGLQPVLLFTVFQVIIFFGAIVNVLYYCGILQWVLLRFATIMRILIGSTAAESLVAVASTMLGQSEAPLMIKPYMAKMTNSELHQVMVSGYASIAGSLFAAYTSFGACPENLLAASIMSAPMSLCVSKLFYPETERSLTRRVRDLQLTKSQDRSVVEALANGAYSVVSIVAVVGANLVVFIAIIAFINGVIGWLGSLVNAPNLSLELIYSYLFFPLAFLMAPSNATTWEEVIDETMVVAELIGTKTVLNEFIAYRRMGEYIHEGRLGDRAQMVATYALCGFSNIASIGIQIGALSGMCPEKKQELPALAVRALLAGSVSCLMTACFASLLVSGTIEGCKPTLDVEGCIDITGLCRCPDNETTGTWLNETWPNQTWIP